MSDRDALAELINPHQSAAFGMWCTCGKALDGHIDQHRADTMLAAGWRPPPRKITDPTELDALPVGTVGITPSGVAWTRWRDRWTANGSTCTSAYLTKHRGPVTVVHVPTEEARDGE